MLATTNNLDINISDNAFASETAGEICEVTGFTDQQGITEDSSALITTREPMNAFDRISLEEFLQRPFVIDQFSWSNSDSRFSLLKKWDFPNDLIVIPALKRKLENFQFLRCDIKISVRLNSTRYHSGKIALAFSPNHSNASTLTSDLSFVHCMSLPHIEVNANDGETAVFVVPFSLPFEYIDLSALSTIVGSSLYNIGSVYMWVMNELGASTNAPVQITVFASMENVTLAGPTSAPNLVIVPPTPSSVALPIGTASFADTLILQSTYLMPQVKDREREQKSEKGIVSGVAETVASFAAPFSTLPVVGPVATAIATGASAIGGLAKVFGFSKPLDQSSNQFMQHRFPVLASGKGLETAPTLGLFPDNAISPSHEHIAGDEDEMQLSRIFSTPGYIGYFNIGASNVRNSIIFARPVTPVDCLCTPEPGFARVDFTPLAFSVAAFEYWRGSLRYHFQFVCSSFHSIRVRIAWSPPGATIDSDPNEVVNLVNHVLDINQSTDFNVTIPFLNALPWLAVPISNSDITRCTNGTIFVQIVNELTFPETPVPDISVNVFSSAGPDFQVAFPTNYRLSQPLVAPFEDEGLMPQVGMSLQDIRTADYPSMIDSRLYVDNNLCHGENVTHLKHILQRSCDVFVNLLPGTYRFNPYNLVETDLTATEFKYTFLSWFGNLFRYQRGSFGLRATRTGGNGSFTFQNRRITALAGTRLQALPGGLAPFGVGTHYVPSSDNYIPEAVAPFYSSQYGVPLNGGRNPYVTNVPVMDFDSKTTSADLFEFAGDDLVLGFLLGAPTFTVDLSRWRYDNTS